MQKKIKSNVAIKLDNILHLVTFGFSLRKGCRGEYLELSDMKVTGGWRKLHNEELLNFYCY